MAVAVAVVVVGPMDPIKSVCDGPGEGAFGREKIE